MTEEERALLEAQRLKLIKIISSGTTEGKHGDKGVKFASMDELEERLDWIDRQLGNPSTRRGFRRTYLRFKRRGTGAASR